MTFSFGKFEKIKKNHILSNVTIDKFSGQKKKQSRKKKILECDPKYQSSGPYIVVIAVKNVTLQGVDVNPEELEPGLVETYLGHVYVAGRHGLVAIFEAGVLEKTRKNKRVKRNLTSW